jgi:hypothetical protein
MQLRIVQAMFLGAFMIACALCLASLASAEGKTAGATTNAALSKAHQSALTHARALSRYMNGKQTASKEVVLGHSEAIGTALQEAAQASTALATEVQADKAKECVETMREHQSDAAAKHQKLTDELTAPSLDAKAIQAIAGDIASEVRDAEQENKRVATLERGVKKDAARGRVPVEQ